MKTVIKDGEVSVHFARVAYTDRLHLKDIDRYLLNSYPKTKWPNGKYDRMSRVYGEWNPYKNRCVWDPKDMEYEWKRHYHITATGNFHLIGRCNGTEDANSHLYLHEPLKVKI